VTTTTTTAKGFGGGGKLEGSAQKVKSGRKPVHVSDEEDEKLMI
jgi:hypothetical protein